MKVNIDDIVKELKKKKKITYGDMFDIDTKYGGTIAYEVTQKLIRYTKPYIKAKKMFEKSHD
jgi:hypothetical protein